MSSSILYLLVLTISSFCASSSYLESLVVVGHRGSPNYMPENTLQSFAVGIYSGANFIELDVQITKDRQVIVLHDPFLGGVTDIKNYPQYANRKKTRYANYKNVTDYFVDDFTLEEIRKFRVYQKLVDTRPTIFDGKYGIPTLEEVIKYISEENKIRAEEDSQYKPVGIFIELKEGDMYRRVYGPKFQMAKFVYEVLESSQLTKKSEADKICPLVLISFDAPSLKYMKERTDLPITQLLKKENIKDFTLEKIAEYADNVGPDFNFLIKGIEDGKLLYTDFSKQAYSHGLRVQPWVIRDDHFTLAMKPEDFYTQLFKSGMISGITTEWPEKASGILSLLKEEEKAKSPL